MEVVSARMECVNDVTDSLRGAVGAPALWELGESAPPGDRSWPDPLDCDIVSSDCDPGRLQKAFCWGKQTSPWERGRERKKIIKEKKGKKGEGSDVMMVMESHGGGGGGVKS